MRFIDQLSGRPNTIKTYESLYRNHIVKYTCDTAIIKDPHRILDVLLDVHWKGLSIGTKCQLVTLFKQYAEFLGIEVSVTKRLKKLKSNHRKERIKALTGPQLNDLLSQCEKEYPDSLYPLVFFAAHTGLRRGELFGITPQDINISKGILIIDKSYNGPTKTGKARILKISKELMMFIQKRNYLLQECHKPIFKNFDPNPRLKKCCIAANVPVISLHGLRHTYATLALDSNKSIKKVQEALGHSNPMTTMSIYWQSVGDLLEPDFIPREGN